MGCGGIVLAGGRSARMGIDKAALAWHGEPLLVHVVRAVRAGLASPCDDQLQGPVVVVGAAGQELPPLPEGVEVVRDSVPGGGPLQGLRDGLAALEGRVALAFVAATDLPLLRPAVVDAVLRAVTDDVDAAVPSVGGLLHPLAAAYRPSLVPLADELLGAGERRVTALVARCRALPVDEPMLRAVDPELRSLVNVNTRAELDALD